MNYYLSDDVYNELIAWLASLEPNPWNGQGLDPDQIMELLGEIAGVWPESIKELTKPAGAAAA